MKPTAGTVDEFRNFVKATSSRFMRAAYVLLGDRQAAEDAMQTALLRTFRHWERAFENPGGYMWRVLVNVCRNERRRRSRVPETQRAEKNDPPSREAVENDVAVRRDLVAALNALPYNQREAVVLRYYLELSVSETAKVLDVPEGTVKSMSARALAHLKRVPSVSGVEVQDVER